MASETILVATAIAMVAPEVKPERREVYADLVVRNSRRQRLDPLLVVALIDRESQWHWLAKNPRTNCVGLMQIAPRHWAVDHKARKPVPRPGMKPYEPTWNIARGTEILRWCLDRPECSGNIWKAVCKYNSRGCVECDARFAKMVLATWKRLRYRLRKKRTS